MFTKLLHLMGIGLFGLITVGCGTTKSKLATEQLLLSDSVDRAIASIDFHPLSGSKVFLDTQYIKQVKSVGFVNSDYLISSLRQQIVTAGCLLQDSKDKAEYILEARVGTLGMDSHDVVYGIPASSALSSAASLVPNAPPIPMIPEISLGKQSDQVGATKLAVFAYHRETRLPVWQSGVAQKRSTSKNTWVLGAGPFQSGTVYEGTQFAGEDLSIPLLADKNGKTHPDALTLYSKQVTFVRPPERVATSEVQQASFKKKADKKGEAKEKQPEPPREAATKNAASAPASPPKAATASPGKPAKASKK